MEALNERASGNGAVALWLHIQRLSRAVPECERWAASRMRTFFAISLLAVLCSASAAEPQFFPQVKRNPRRESWYSEHLKAMREPSIYEQRMQPGMQFRFLHLPTFHKPSAIRITRIATGAELRVIRLSGAGGYDPGKVEMERTRKLDETQWKHLLTLLDKTSFWTSPEEESYQSGNDGSQWILEGRSEGKYHVVDRWTPRSDSARKLEAFVACCMYLRELAELPKDEELY